MSAASRPSFARPAELDFADLAQRHLDDVYGYLLYLTRDPELAEDLTADAFERALKRFRRYDPRRGEPKTWLLQLARSAALDHFRADKRRRRREELAAVPEHQDDLALLNALGAELSPSLKQALKELSPLERELVFLRVVLEVSNKEAARLLGLSEGACATRLSRTLAKLEEKVTRYEL